MTILLILLFILECLAFCYLFLQQLEISKDIDTLYKNYADQLEKVTKSNITLRGNITK